ncbi:MAG: sulfatase [Candidatus Aminicenantes bacterium]|nr:sulfatase [Candidatus Aminicenantes bacterium]
MNRIKYVLIVAVLLLTIVVVYHLLFDQNDDLTCPTYPNANVILIVVDTLRADHLGCYGYSRNTSPVIDRLANEGIIFKNMLAQSSWTRSSTASILTGLYPKNHGANTREQRLSEEVILLPEILGKHGYHSYAFVQNVNVGVAVGFNQGYKDFFTAGETLKDDYPNMHVITGHLNGDLLQSIQKLKNTSNNFIYIHYIDPHVPYTPREKYFSKSNKTTFPMSFFRSRALYSMNKSQRLKTIEEMINAYDDEVLFNDKMIGNLIQTLKEKNVYSNSIIIVTSDHGEEFFEHGGLLHGQTLYEEQLRVPLIIRLPNGIHKEVNSIANQVDILPTILSLLKIPVPGHIDGIDILNIKNRPGPYSYAELDLDGKIFNSIQTTKEKLIEGVIFSKQKEQKYRWFRERAGIKTTGESLELIISSFRRNRTIQVLLDGKVLDQLEITPKTQIINIPLPAVGEKIVTIKSLTPCRSHADIGVGNNTQCLAFRLFKSKSVNINDNLIELHKEYYMLAEDPGELNNGYNQKKFKKIIMQLKKKLKKYKLDKRNIRKSEAPVKFSKEELNALKALGYIN